MPRGTKKTKIMPRIDYSNVVEFPRGDRLARGLEVMIPRGSGIDGDATGTLTVTSDMREYGLFRGDVVLCDKTLVPKMGDLCVVLEASDNVTVRRYWEMIPTDELRGVVWGFQRQFDRG